MSANLPEPCLDRWQPLRLGVVEIFHYDSEEFWFRDGRLLLRGNNGTGKSKVLSLTLPFLLDANLRPSRIEPDGDSGKKMAWNLLMGRYERRMGYTWIEFGRKGTDGVAQYLTLGCGLSAVAARSNKVDAWFFLAERGRVGRDFWLTSASRVVLTRERLDELLQGFGGKVFPNALSYRRAVDDRLFHLGEVRYEALMDTLIQLRQPQLSKKPDEANLSNALTEAFPPLGADLLADVSEAMNQLEEYRRELNEYEALERAVQQFNRRYRLYAATQTRRQARHLRSSQTGFDNASRTVNEARTAFADAQAEETLARQIYADCDRKLMAERVRQEELQSDPAMTSAKQLEQIERDAQRRGVEAVQAGESFRAAQGRALREQLVTRDRGSRVDDAVGDLSAVRQNAELETQNAGLEAAYRASILAAGDAVGLSAGDIAAAQEALRQAALSRRDGVVLMRRRHAEVDQAEHAAARAQSLRDERRDEMLDAEDRRARAEVGIEHQGGLLLNAWQVHLDGLRQISLQDGPAVMDALAAWTNSLEGINPARAALQVGQQEASTRLARQGAELEVERRRIAQEFAELRAEADRLAKGNDAAPPPVQWRDAGVRGGRAGAPFWQLVDFQDGISEAHRAGSEAALQACGLLDAWVMPDGALLTSEGGKPIFDTQWLTQRMPVEQSLAQVLRPATQPEASLATVPVSVIEPLLASVVYCAEDPGNHDTWLAPDGRFRIGALGGAWSKGAAEFIGYSARLAARQRRCEEIARLLEKLQIDSDAVARDIEENLRDQSISADEWNDAPTDDALRAAHAETAVASREFQSARLRFDQAAAAMDESFESRTRAQASLRRDAADLSLPSELEALQSIDQALQSLRELLPKLAHAARHVQEADKELSLQLAREHEADADAASACERFAECEAVAEESRMRALTLRESVGAAVEALQLRLQEVRADVRNGESQLKRAGDERQAAGEARAKAEQKLSDAESTLQERLDARHGAVGLWQGFAATGLLPAALPDIDIPALDTPWTIDPALTLARRVEQDLISVKDDDDSWNRVQNQLSEEYTELQRSLAALSHQAQAETSDYGLVVEIVYQSRAQRPDVLERQLGEEIAQRRALLTANERKVLENHLQAEIASAIQRLLRDADRQVEDINKELEKRPTTTGVRFRLSWQPLPEGDGGAPVGLEEARRRLLNTSADLWSQDDRRVVGEMLQQRIAAERSRADAGEGGTLLDQLARALDYRRWHRFKVMRWQEGQWRPLSGPASSGERALGLTVPLFAAVSRFYTHSGSGFAPRLVLLDEAFAGIDDEARTHCWALIREFDLDFVITSEREWACSAELPGVAIAQLQRREGIDAVYVSRWTWDGKAPRPEVDPNNRFPPE